MNSLYALCKPGLALIVYLFHAISYQKTPLKETHMALSNIQAMALALIPGRAEAFKKGAMLAGQQSWIAIAERVRSVRNQVYWDVVFTAAATIGFVSFSPSTTYKYIYGAFIALGFAATGLNTKKLHEATSFVQGIINSA